MSFGMSVGVYTRREKGVWIELKEPKRWVRHNVSVDQLIPDSSSVLY